MTNFFPRAARLLLLLLPLMTLTARAQNVGIGTTAPDVSAALDIVSSTKGALLPRVAAAAALATPATGLLVFQTGAPAGFYFNAGTAAAPAWQQLNVVGGAGDNLGNHTATSNLQLGANALTGTGASIGTTVGVGIRADGGLNLGQNTTGNSLYLGYQAGRVSTGANNLFSGFQSGYSNTTGNNNQFGGYNSGYFNTTGNNNQFGGYNSGYNNTTGFSNQFSGYNSGYFNTSGYYNLFSGYQSGFNNTTGNNNQFSGALSGYYNTTGQNNQFSGVQSGYYNTTGTNNQFNGYQSGYNSIGNGNNFSGYRSGTNNTTGSYNDFSGYQSGYSNTTGDNNTALGAYSGPSTGGLFNATALGAGAVVSQSNSLVLGSGANVGIGTSTPGAKLHVAGAVKIDATHTLEFGAGIAGKEVNAGKIGYQVFSTALDIVGAGPSGGTRTIKFWAEGGATFTGSVTGVGAFNTSDRRFKTNIRPLGGALASVLALRGVRYTWNALGVAHGGTAGAGQVGLLAQEVEAIYPELVQTDANGYKSVNYAQLTPVLIEAMKELAARNAALEAKATTLEDRAAQADADHASLLALQAQMARLLSETAPATAQARK